MAGPCSVDSTDLILLLLHASATSPEGPAPEIRGSTRLQKLLFLALNEDPVDPHLKELAPSFGFQPYHYGPFSDRVEDQVAFLERLGLVQVSRQGDASLAERMEQQEAADPFEVTGSTVETQAVYSLTGDGRRVAKKLKDTADKHTWMSLRRLLLTFGSMELGELIAYVYSRYPTMASRSRLRQRP